MARAAALAARGTLIFTGAAQAWLVVNRPATGRRRLGQDQREIAFLPLFEPLPVPRRLMPKHAGGEKAYGAVMEPGILWNDSFMGVKRFGKVRHQVAAVPRHSNTRATGT